MVVVVLLIGFVILDNSAIIFLKNLKLTNSPALPPDIYSNVNVCSTHTVDAVNSEMFS